jgi:hypothetical protein
MATKTFTESNLTFTFEETHWEILKFDEHPKYIEISNALAGTKAIDFLGFYNNTAFVMFEVKGFRGYGSQKSVNDRLAEGMEVLSTEIAQKVKDTAAAIVGISRNIRADNTLWQKAVKQIIENKSVIIVAWIEEDLNNIALKARKKNEMSVRAEKLKNKLKWLTTNVSVDNIKEQHAIWEGFTVKHVIHR